ncbi:MAG TPA: hypothetical protein VK886_14875, partial [Vicinamibacterales bacterium]|nr:hypothetical protein [Vicinamibacterales bacterium]
NFQLNGRVRLQFRWDIFNIFNNTNFLYQGMNTGMGLNSIAYDNADPTRATTITNAAISGNFGQAVRTRDPRQMQFGFKVLW